ncbi:hypothetical protein KP509_20G004700 [Ceratopteris richardii]|uniref:Uncharacterized protein n=1 Tax=Ceratopteris richardii TaxID=49495 RepID=A0A8T2SGD9_CERRI|nr:hypothetical protein KP509_20G004700 [Ceratopteris richardii]
MKKMSHIFKKLKLRWHNLFCDRLNSHSPSATAPPHFLPVLCIGPSSCKGYAVALPRLRNPVLIHTLTDAASLHGDGHAAILMCDPHTFEATFCLLERSFQGLISIPLSRNVKSSQGPAGDRRGGTHSSEIRARDSAALLRTSR